VEFFIHLIMMDNWWVCHYDSETAVSMQWKHPDSLSPKKVKSQPSSGRVMLSVFWYRRGAIMTNYAQNGVTITGEYSRNLLRNLREEIKKKRRGRLGIGV
jgi:hypothetical protein